MASSHPSTRIRLFYIDNLRILLTVLVVIQHLIVAYGGGSGWWYYNDPVRANGFSWYTMTFAWLLNQAFFMGFLFLLSSYFSPGSYDRKGSRVYIQERLKRLGIPLAAYLVLVNPILAYIAWIQSGAFEGNFGDFLPLFLQSYKSLDVGVLWFVEVLLIFAFVYILWRWIDQFKPILSWKTKISTYIPQKLSNYQIAIFSLTLGVLVFTDRTLFYENPFLQLLGLPRGHIVQYAAMLAAGVIAYRQNWFLTITRAQGTFWTLIATGLLFVLPAILAAAGIQAGRFSPYAAGGKWAWQSLLMFSIWEQLMCVAIIVSLSIWFREELNHQTAFTKALANDTYSVYVVHAPVITFLIFALRNIPLEPVIKCTLVAPIAIPLCFLVGHLFRELPFAKNIL